MEWLTPLYGKIVALDTAPLIYFFEGHPDFYPRVEPFFQAMHRGDFEVVTSILTLTEALVRPIRNNNAELARTYQDVLLNTDSLQTVLVTTDIAETAARLRVTHKLRTPDAVQVATAIVMEADFILTNDSKLSAIRHPTVLMLDNLR